MTKPDYIQFLELNNGVFSLMQFHKFRGEIVGYLDDKFERVYEFGVVPKKGIAKWKEVIYQTKQNFYMHLKASENDEEDYFLDIYYMADKRNELLYVTTQLLKPFINGTVNNAGAQE